MKINWLKNNSDVGGAMQMVIDSCASQNIVIHSQTKKNGRMWADVNELELLNLIKKNNGVYEVLNKYPQKVHFDIDRDHKETPTEEQKIEFDNKIISSINLLFPNSDMAISGSISEKRTSRHITLNNYILENKEDKETLKIITKYLYLNCDNSFDTKIYTTNRNWKCINQSKDDGRIQEIIINTDIKKHLVGSFVSSDALRLPTFKNIELNEDKPELKIINKNVKQFLSDEKVNSKLDFGTLKHLNLTLPNNFNIDMATSLELLNLLPLDDTFNHIYTYRACLYAFFNNISIDDFLNWYSKKNSSDEKKQKWRIHYNNMTNKQPYKKENLIKVLKFYYKELNVSYKMANFSNLFNIDDIPTQIIETLDQTVFNKKSKIEDVNQTNQTNQTKPNQQINLNSIITTDKQYLKEKYTIITHGMSSGKTAQTIENIIKAESFIWITNNEALSLGVFNRMFEYIDTLKINDEQKEIKKNEIKHYKISFENQTKDQKNEGIIKAKKLIICINSLKKIGVNNYKDVIIDEADTFFKNFHNNETLETLKLENWTTLIRILREAKKVILLDAFTSKITTNTIKAIDPGQDITVFKRNKETSNLNIEFMTSYELLLNDAIEDIKNGKKIFIFYPYKQKRGNKYPSMQELTLKIEEQTLKKGIFYNAIVDDKINKGLRDVNKNWLEHDFIITNTKITVGVNFDKIYFDRVYLFIAGFNSTRDIIQVSRRCRTLNDKLIKCVFMDKHNSNKVFENDDNLVKNCPIYSEMSKLILIEKMAPLQASFILFCEKAGFNIIKNNERINKKLKVEMDALFKNSDIGYSFDKLKNITFDESEEIKHKINSSVATMDDKLTLQKYFFIGSFVKTVDKNILADAWDDKYNSFFHNVEKLAYGGNIIFNDIMKFNNWLSIIPTNQQLKQVKLNDDIINNMFEKYKYIDLTKKSTHQALFKNTINKFFGRNIINSKLLYENSKNREMFISDNNREMFEFAINNLKIFKIDDVKQTEDIFIDTDEDEENEININDDDIFVDEE